MPQNDKKPVVKVVSKSVQMKVDRPTPADKKREKELMDALSKENFKMSVPKESPLMRAKRIAGEVVSKAMTGKKK